MPLFYAAMQRHTSQRVERYYACWRFDADAADALSVRRC